MGKTQGLGIGTLYNLFARVILVLSGFATAVVLGRVLGPETYGVYSVVLSLILTITLNSCQSNQSRKIG
jgi:O-antigen/teichoic acid export membrane protein